MSDDTECSTAVVNDDEIIGGFRALVVDDSRVQRRILNKSLSRWGFEVIEAASGEEALEECRLVMPDLIISDWMMPGMSGLEFCQAFRDLAKDHFAYFILITSKSEKTAIALGLNSGADDFLVKPLNSDELRARVNSGARILKMQRELSDKNDLITITLERLEQVHEEINKDLREAQRLQQSLIRERSKSFDAGQLSLLLRSAGHVGGDLVGFFPAGPSHVGLYALDVSGHGISSALMTARLAGYLSATSPDQNVALEKLEDGSCRPRAPSEVIETLNKLVLNELETEHYFTLLLVFVNLETGKTVLAQAGHPHPVIQRANGDIEQTGTGGFPVGLMEGVSFSQFETQLYPGDRLLLLSDGVTECPGPKGEMLGEEGLEEIVKKLKDVQQDVFLDALVWELTRFAEQEDFPDDVSGILWEFSSDAVLRNVA